MKEQQEKLGKCIYLNGATSAGKSSIARVLQELLQEPYLHVEMDAFLLMMPGRYLGSEETAKEGFYWKESYDNEGQKIIEIEIGSIGKRLRSGMYGSWVALLNAGNNLIVDDVNFGRDQVDVVKELLASYHSIFVGVKCELSELERREKRRGDRVLYTARAQYALVHRNVIYDYEVDSTTFSTIECAKQIKNYLFTKI